MRAATERAPRGSHHEWQWVPLGELIEIFDHKRVPVSSRERTGRRGSYPYYGAQGVIDSIDDYLFDGDYILLAEDGENLNSRKLPLALRASGKFWVNNHAHVIRGLRHRIDDRFLLAALNHADIKPFVTGAAQPKLSQANLRLIPIPLPPLPTQRRIADVLCAYDDLIENCERRIRVLDEMARALYREWFVLFRYPGSRVDRQVTERELPGGWRRAALRDGIGTIQDGDWIETKDQGGSDYRLVQISNIGVGQFVETGNYRFVTSATFRRLHCTEVKPGDLLVARMPAPIGRAWLVHSMPWPMITAVDVAIIRPTQGKLSARYLGAAWNDPTNLARVAAQASGTTRPRVTRRELEALSFVVPPLELQKQFEDHTQPMATLAADLRNQVHNLRLTRDLLLPRLVTGQIPVPGSA